MKRAILVIDVQNEYVTGNLPIEYPPINESLANIDKIIKTANMRNIPVIAFQHTAPETSPIFAKNSDGWELNTVVTQNKLTKIVQKQQASCFVGTDLQQWLEENQITTLTIVGYMTHNCNASTAIQAAHMGYEVEIIQNATGSVPYKNAMGVASAEEIYRVFNIVMYTGFATLVTANDWITALDSKQTFVKSNIYESNQEARKIRNK